MSYDSNRDFLYGTLVYEFQHLLQKVKCDNHGTDAPEHWYNEMLSCICIDLMKEIIKTETIMPQVEYIATSPEYPDTWFIAGSYKGFLDWSNIEDGLAMEWAMYSAHI